MTGGTGFIGAHSAAALVRAGHELRLLVRSADRVRPALDPLGVTGVDVVEGDARDPRAVAALLDGCEALLHCAAVYTWGAKQQEDLVGRNVELTDAVLGTAVERGLDPVVHVSSYVALLPSEEPLHEDAPVGSSTVGYAASKAASESIAREHQVAGAPVVITYPGTVVGPHDPRFGASNAFLLGLVGSSRPATFGGVPCVDVRDVAAIHAAVMEAGRGPRRFLSTGHDVTVAELARRVGRVAEVAVRPLAVPAGMLPLAGRLLDAVGRRTPFDLPGGSHAIAALTGFPGTRSTRAADHLGIRYRPLDDTLRDAVTWFREAGHLRRPPRSAPAARPA